MCYTSLPAGLDHNQVLEILDDPIALVSDTSWLPQAVLQRPEAAVSSNPSSSVTADAEEEREEGEAEAGEVTDPAAAAAAGEGGEGEEAGEDEEDGMTLLELAHVSLTACSYVASLKQPSCTDAANQPTMQRRRRACCTSCS